MTQYYPLLFCLRNTTAVLFVRPERNQWLFNSHDLQRHITCVHPSFVLIIEIPVLFADLQLQWQKSWIGATCASGSKPSMRILKTIEANLIHCEYQPIKYAAEWEHYILVYNLFPLRFASVAALSSLRNQAYYQSNVWLRVVYLFWLWFRAWI